MNKVIREGEILYLDFYGYGYGHSDQNVYFTTSQTAKAGVDFQAVDYAGPSPFYREGEFAFSIVVPTFKDDILEGDETFVVTQYDINDGRIEGRETFTITITDTTNKIVYVDLDLDHEPEAIEINAYNHANVMMQAQMALAMNGLQRRSVDEKLDELEKQILSGEMEAAKKAAGVLGLDAAVMRGALKDAFPGLQESHLKLAETIFTTAKSTNTLLDGDADAVAKMIAVMEGISAWSTQMGHPHAVALRALTLAANAVDIGVDVLKIDLLREQFDHYFERQSDLVFKSKYYQDLIDAARLVDAALPNRIAAFSMETAPATKEVSFNDLADGVVEVGDIVIRKAIELGDGETLRIGSRETVISGDGSSTFLLSHTSSQNVIDAGGGFDTVVITGTKSDYLATDTGSGWSLTNGSVGNIFVNVERIVFSDGWVALDFDGNAGQAYRLYQAAFERAPDNDGLKYWIGRLDSGDTSLTAIAESFLNSPEFVSTYGTEETVSNARFVELLYTHTLGRDYDQDGYRYWLGKLDTAQTNRRDLLAFFSESDENKGQVAEAIQDGIWLY